MLNLNIMQGKLLKDVVLMDVVGGDDEDEKKHSKRVTFTIINTRDYRDKNGNRQSDFFDVIAWDDKATFIAENFKKGDRILIVGRFQHRLYKRSDGERRRSYELVVKKVYFDGPSSAMSAIEDVLTDCDF